MARKPINIELLQAIYTVHQKKQMNLAAKELNLTPSALSQAIRKLEAELKTELLDHSRRPLTLTPAGRRLLREGLPILQAAIALQDDFTGKNLKNISLRLGLSETITSTVSPWLISTVQNRVAELEIESHFNLRLTELLKAGELDVCIYSEGLLGEPDWVRSPIYEESFFGVSAQNIPSVKTVSQLRELAATRPFVCYNTISYDRRLVDQYLHDINVEPRRRIQVGSSYTLVGLINLVNGWTLLPPINLWSGGESAKNVSLWNLPTKASVTRRIWAIGRTEYAAEINWISRITRELVQTHTLPEIQAISPFLTKHLKLLPDAQKEA